MTDVSDQVSRLSPGKRALFQKLMLENRLRLSRAQPIARRQQQDLVPLSFAQQRLWFLDQLEPGSTAYNISRTVRLSGTLDLDALQRTLDAIVARHESLRTTFGMKDGQPVQVIVPHRTLTLHTVDLQELPEAVRLAEAERLARSEAQQPFDLAHDPLLRVTVLQLSGSEYVVLLTMHHIVSDGWSMQILVREIGLLYAAFSTGRISPLPELPIHYADYAVWQREWLAGEVLEAQLAYWKKQLSGAPLVLELPTDRMRPATLTFQGACQPLSLSPNLTEQLKTLSQDQNVTLFMLLLAAFQVLLSRYTSQPDIVVGTPIANRNRTEVEGLIGFFANTLALRTDLSGNPSFRELLHQVREIALDAYAHQDLPFEKLVEELQPERSLNRTPLFQVAFVLHNVQGEEIAIPGLRLTPWDVEGGTAKFDLTMALMEGDAGLTGTLEYNSDLFAPERMAGLARLWQTLLEGIVADPDRHLWDLPLLTPAERHDILEHWSSGQRKYPVPQSLGAWFEEQVAQRPQAIAVTLEDAAVSYAALNRRANRVAHYLQECGVRSGALVGICMERSIELIIGLLGILKAGGAYLPLDPTYPKERLAFMLRDAGVRLLLTEACRRSDWAAEVERVVVLDTERGELAAAAEDNPDSGVHGDAVAYVIYTSGTTGQPKGTLVSHSNVMRLLAATEAWYGFAPDDVWTMFHSYAFDFSVWELWGALLYGGRLVIVPYWVSRTPDKFAELLMRERVTVLNQTPSAFRGLMQAEQARDAGQGLALRWVIFGGEALDLASLKPWFERHGEMSPRMVNMYGITETTVHVTYRPVQLVDVDETASLIGRALPDLEVYVLDRQLVPVPPGVVGELYIGGAGVAYGYLNRAELTVEKFIPHPFSNEPGKRLYKTGDLARYRLNGDLEYCGRADEQVKIRGFRVELGEIQAVLSQHAGVREAVVSAREDGSGEKRLVAYLVADAEHAPTIGELHHFLRHKVPEYMVPSSFVFLARLPLTPNGKVDRLRLPLPERIRPELGKDLPQTALEEVLAGVWAEVLDLEAVGIHDDFFELGGHSLLVVQLIFRVRDVFHMDLPVRTVFETRTVAGLAEALVQYEPVPGQFEAIARVRKKINGMSADQVQAFLSDKKRAKGGQ